METKPKVCPVSGYPLKPDGTPDLSSMYISKDVVRNIAESNKLLEMKTTLMEKQLEIIKKVFGE